MPIQHKHFQSDWKNGYRANNAILDITPYEPEALFLGTFNPDTPHANFSDFYYGRNYFWPGFMNMFVYNGHILTERRIAPNAHEAPNMLLPSLDEIFHMCQTARLTFADLIYEVLHANNPQYNLLENDNVVFNGLSFNLIDDGALGRLHGMGQVHWNTDNIISYLINTPSIRSIYFTRKPTGVWRHVYDAVRFHPTLADRNFTNIYTPSGQALAGAPRMHHLLNKWLIGGDNFGHLDHDWLHAHEVALANFLLP